MTKKILHCPKCGYPQYCGCKSCIRRLPEGIKPYKWTEDGESISCGNCGFTQSGDWWLTLEEDVFLTKDREQRK